MSDPDTTSPAHIAEATAGIREALALLVGRWQTQGRMRADGRSFAGTDRYHWVAGGHFLVHDWDVQMPDGRTTGIEVIGKRADGGGFAVHVYDDQGDTSVSTLRIDGDALRIDSHALRFRGRFLDGGGVLEGTWESQVPESLAWSPLMDVRLEKVDASAH